MSAHALRLFRPAGRRALLPLLLLLSGLFLGMPGTRVRADVQAGPAHWEPFAARFRRPLPANILSTLQSDLAAAYHLHLQNPKNPEHLSAVASFHFQLLEYNQAAACYRRLLHLDPANREAPAWFAECIYHAGSLDPAQRLFAQFETHHLATPITSVLLAEIHFRKQKFPESIALLERVLDESKARADDPAYAPLWQHVAHNLQVARDAVSNE